MAAPISSVPRGSVSDHTVLVAARGLRAVSTALEIGLAAVTAGAVLAIGSVHAWAYVPLFWATGVLAMLAAARVVLVRKLRMRLGRCRFAFHVSRRWLVLDDDAPYGVPTWSFNLDRPPFRVPPLLVPGLALLAWVMFQMIPLPAAVTRLFVDRDPASETAAWSTLSVSTDQTLRGAGFLVWALVLHAAAAAALDRRESEERFRSFIRWLGCLVALVGLIQFAAQTRLVYGIFRPLESTGALMFGPFINRNHFATYMLLVTPLAFGLLASAYRRYRARVGSRANLRRRLVSLSQTEGVSLLYAIVPALTTVAALIATTSRGGLLAFAGALTLAGAGLLRRRSVPPWAVAIVFTAVAFSWFGLERVHVRMEQLTDDSPGRTLVWADTLHRLEQRWLVGYGFNTFGSAVTRATAWDLPAGATPWREPYESTVVETPRAGFRTPNGIPGLEWYREAHNDYLQILAEVGAIGLLLAGWAAARLIVAVRGDPWLLAAIGGVLLHAFVDFGLQVPAIAGLFVTVASLRPHVG